MKQSIKYKHDKAQGETELSGLDRKIILMNIITLRRREHTENMRLEWAVVMKKETAENTGCNTYIMVDK